MHFHMLVTGDTQRGSKGPRNFIGGRGDNGQGGVEEEKTKEGKDLSESFGASVAVLHSAPLPQVTILIFGPGTDG